MTIYNFDAPVDRQGTYSEKWDKYQGTDIIPMWVADMDFMSPPAVINALMQRVQHGVFGYTRAPDPLVDEILKHTERDLAWRIKPEWIVWLPGLVCGLNVLCRTTPDENDEIVGFTPIYPPFLSAPGLSSRHGITVPLRYSGNEWSIDFQELEKAITSRTRMILLCHPHNPTGRVWSRDELSAIADIALRHHLIVGSDEIHAGLILDEDKIHIPIASLSPEISRQTITLMAPSKTYNIAGLGCSFAIISDPELRQQFIRAKGRIVPHVNVLAYIAALSAYKDGGDWKKALIRYLRENRDFLENEIKTVPGITMSHVSATYLAWLDVRKLGLTFPQDFFEKAGVGLSDGAEFGASGFLRLNFGCRRTLLQEAIIRLKKAVLER